MRSLILFALLFSTPAFAFGSKKVTADPVTQSSLLDGDATGIVEGCGQQPSPLGVFCRQVEGDASDKNITFIGPPAKCDRPDACVFIKVFNNEGELAWGGSIPKGQTRVTVPWKTLLASGTFELASRGFWTFNTQVFWIDQDGRARDSVSQGDIVLRVYRSGYTPLHASAQDPSFVWTWSDDSFVYRMTAGLRAFVGRK